MTDVFRTSMWANSFASKEQKELLGAKKEGQGGSGSSEPAAGKWCECERQMQGYGQADDVALCVALTFGR